MELISQLGDVEAVLLTGGASRRMGQDKASLTSDGIPIAKRIAESLGNYCSRVTILGREPIPGFAFQQDEKEFEGPRRALDAFKPSLPYTFVASCDMPNFDPKIILMLRKRIGSADIAIPKISEFLQPLCALYASKLIGVPSAGSASMMSLLQDGNHTIVTEVELVQANLRPTDFRNCNTPEEFEEAMKPKDQPLT